MDPLEQPIEYELLEELGRGAMGVVHRARQVSLDRIVAVKILKPEAMDLEDLKVRLRREGRALSQVRHPNLVQVLDCGSMDGRPFVAMELIEGETLGHLIRERLLDWPRQVESIFEATIGAVAALHEAGMVHRDLKPDNVMIATDGRPVVMDLGLVKDLSAVTSATGTGHSIGTPAYMAPEVVMGAVATPQADVWALGCILYVLYTGQRPFKGPSVEDYIRAILGAEIPDLAQACPSAPAAHQTLLRLLLERDLSRRPANAQQALEVLRGIQKREAKRTRNRTDRVPSTPRPATGVSPRARVQAASVVMALCIALGALTLWLGGDHRSRQRGAPWGLPGDAVARSAAPSNDSSGGEPAPILASSSWAKVAARRTDLLAGGDRARKAIKDLIASTTLDLGRDPSEWLYWADLGRRLQEGSLDRESRRTSRPMVDPWQVDLMFGPHLSGSFGLASVELLGAAVRLLRQWPDCPLGWLMLGTYLVKEHPATHAKAVAAYTEALRAPWPPSWGLTRLNAWKALADALMMVPGRSLEREFWTRARGLDLQACHFVGLSVALVEDPARFERMLDTACVQFPTTPLAAHWRSSWICRDRHDRDRALRRLDDFQRARPDSGPLLEMAVGAHLAVGDVSSVRRLTAKRSLPEWPHTRVDWLELGSAAALIDTTSASGPPFLVMLAALHQRVESGDLPEAQKILEGALVRRDRSPSDVAMAAASLMGRVPDPSRAMRIFVQAMATVREPGLEAQTWAHTVGALKVRSQESTLDRLVAQTGIGARNPLLARLIKALWWCRVGCFTEALEECDPSLNMTDDRTAEASVISELVTRAVLAADKGDPGAALVVERLKDLTIPTSRQTAKTYISAVLLGDWGRVRDLARDLTFLDGTSAIWPLAWLWGSRKVGTGPQRDQVESQVRSALRARNALWALEGDMSP